MSRGWLTWSSLGVVPEERKALRKAGIAATDLATLEPLDVVAASEEVVTDERASLLCGRATLLQVATPAWVRSLERVGVENRDDLVARHPADLFDTWQVVSPYTGPDIYRYLASTIAAAGGPEHPVPDDEDLVRRAWTVRFGESAEPTKTKLRLRVPVLKVNAAAVVTPAMADGRPKPPLRPDHVALTSVDDPTSFVGHWQWAGRFAPFLRLETLAPGDPVEVVQGREKMTYEVAEVRRGVSPVHTIPPPDGIVMISPPHLRWPPWLRDWGLPGAADLERTWVQVAVTAVPAWQASPLR